MQNKQLIMIIVSIGVLGLLLLIVFFGILCYIVPSSRRPVSGIKGYVEFKQANKHGFVFKYPSNWIKEKTYKGSVSFIGPGTKETPYAFYLVAHKYDTEKLEADILRNKHKVKNIEDYYNASTDFSDAKQLEQDNHKILFKKYAHLDGQKALWFSFSYDNLYAKTPQKIPLKRYHKRIEEIVTKKGDNWYTIILFFYGDEKYYDKYYEAFLKAKDTFRIID